SQTGCRTGLAHEPADQIAVRAQLGPHQLDRHARVERNVMRGDDHAHAARAEDSLDTKPARQYPGRADLTGGTANLLWSSWRIYQGATSRIDSTAWRTIAARQGCGRSRSGATRDACRCQWV